MAVADTRAIRAVANRVSASANPRSSESTRLLRFRVDRDERLELEEALLADPLDVHQLLDLLEPARLLPVLEDALGRGAADAWQRFEIRQRGGVEIDGRGPGDGWSRRLSRDRNRANGHGARDDGDEEQSSHGS